MKKVILPIILVLEIVIIIGVVFAENIGDGTYTVKNGDSIILDNGWKIVIKSIGIGSASEILGIDYYDSEGNPVIASNIHDRGTNSFMGQIQKIEGAKKFGTSTHLKFQFEILEVSGETISSSGMWVEKENAKINVISIDETLPGAMTENDGEEIQEVNKVLTYKDSQDVNLIIGEETTLGNGYKLKLERFDQRWGNPYFLLYNSEGDIIESNIGIGKDADANLGSYIYIKDYSNKEVNLKIIEGTKLTFGTGWNMFSIPLEDGDGFGTVLESSCNDAILWIWNNDLNDYEKIGILKEGTKIPSNKGIWAKIRTKNDITSEEDCGVLVSGKKSITTNGTKLKAGWNLIGSPISSYGKSEISESGSTFNALTFNDILGDCKIEKGPWQYLSTIWTSNYWQNSGEQGGLTEYHKFTKPLQNKLMLNRGYFIKVIDDCTLGDI
jgi:hypothetical protein